jgi:protein-S-isoprenylcysteine O-methyltransferase Ste14
MIADKIFYADAHHHVIVTDSTFIVKDKEYNIPSIHNHLIKEVKPVPVLGSIVTTVGVLLAMAGMFQIVSFDFIPTVTLAGKAIDGYWWAVLAGILLISIGLLLIVIVKPRYALHISTAQGEDDVIVSSKREYIREIIDALNRAFMLRTK